MFKGILLTLMIGPAVPMPVSKEVLDDLTAVEVTTATEDPSVFRLEFKLSPRSPLHTVFLLSGGAPIPMIRVIIIATVNAMPEVLMDGVMTNHEVRSGADGGPAILSIIGEDLSRVMDYIDFSGIPYPAMPAEARVAMILAKYAVLGIVPMVIPSIFVDVPLPTSRIPRQWGKDLPYIKYLASAVGYTFYVDPGPAPGMSIAYWGPEIRIGVPQPALNVDMDAHTNVESLSFNYDSDAKAMPILWITKKVPIPIPVPDISLLKPPLGLVQPIPKKFYQITGLAKLSATQAAAAGMAEASKTADVATGSGSLDVLRYGRILKARKLVGVRGAGTAFDGLYYVNTVKHRIKRGEYKQDFELSRNGLISTLPRVPV